MKQLDLKERLRCQGENVHYFIIMLLSVVIIHFATSFHTIYDEHKEDRVEDEEVQG